MPRQQRIKSESGIYHIMLRGVNKQAIFQDDEDNLKFISILNECKAKSEFQLFAYCLMGNHVHILLQEGKEPLELIFKRLGSRYVYWYNTKYQRVGHLFQDRFKSEPVETDEYFLTVVKYIHQNPLKAGLIHDLSDFWYSSYSAYLKNSGFVDTGKLLEMISLEEIKRYHQTIEQTECLDIKETKPRVTDEQAKEIIRKLSGCENSYQFQQLTGDVQNEYIKQFKKHHLSIRQISRLTGVTIGFARKN